MKKIAVILAGCGHADGSEIREAVLTALALDKHSAEASFFAPDVNQMDVINHITGEKLKESRNVLIEAGRIARGNIKALEALKPGDFDGMIIPGGYGAAKNLSDIAVKSESASVIPQLKSLILAFLNAKKAIGAICIAPAVVAKATQGSEYKLKLTLGNYNKMLTTFGAEQEVCSADTCIIDERNKVVSTPAYMTDSGLYDISIGIEQLVKKVLDLC